MTKRWSQTQALTARYLNRHGWPYAQPVGAGRPGSDVTGVPGLAVEVKARADFSPAAFLRQAKQNAALGDLPFVVIRPPGGGPSNVDAWPVLLTFADLVGLLYEAGYGSGPGAVVDPRMGIVRKDVLTAEEVAVSEDLL